jgi:hypothetical protein
LKKRLKKSLIMPQINFLSDQVQRDIMKGRDYSQPVDSEEAFKYRRNDDNVRRDMYNKLRRLGIPSQDAQRFKDWKPHHVKDVVRHKEMDDYGLSPEWIKDPVRREQKIQEMREDYAKAGIHKEPGEPLTPEETNRLNQYYQSIGKPEVEDTSEADFAARNIQQNKITNAEIPDTKHEVSQAPEDYNMDKNLVDRNKNLIGNKKFITHKPRAMVYGPAQRVMQNSLVDRINKFTKGH